MKTQFHLLLLALFFLGAAAHGLSGGWKVIDDVRDPHVLAMGRFAVWKHNNDEGNRKLTFEEVVSGEKQVVSGVKYKLITMSQVGDTYHYAYGPQLHEAIVWERPGNLGLKLISFRLIYEY